MNLGNLPLTTGIISGQNPFMAITKRGARLLRKGRSSQKGGVYFVTTSTFGRRAHFANFHRACAMSRQLHELPRHCSCRNLCWVVMPDHVHLLVQLGDLTLNRLVQRLKSRSAVMLNREFHAAGQFWSCGYYDHVLRKSESVRDVSDYIVWNPVRAGLVERPADYPFWDAAWL